MLRPDGDAINGQSRTPVPTEMVRADVTSKAVSPTGIGRWGGQSRTLVPTEMG